MKRGIGAAVIAFAFLASTVEAQTSIGSNSGERRQGESRIQKSPAQPSANRAETDTRSKTTPTLGPRTNGVQQFFWWPLYGYLPLWSVGNIPPPDAGAA